MGSALKNRDPDSEPGGTPLGRRLREAFLETEENVSPLAELLLFAADRAQHVNFLVKPALEQGKIVISDRYADATFAYQGAGRGFPAATVNQVIKLATDGLKPDLTIFFDLPIENKNSARYVMYQHLSLNNQQAYVFLSQNLSCLLIVIDNYFKRR